MAKSVRYLIGIWVGKGIRMRYVHFSLNWGHPAAQSEADEPLRVSTRSPRHWPLLSRRMLEMPKFFDSAGGKRLTCLRCDWG